ncbi:TRAP transporter large permease [Salicibibacter cibarius]|uniref:TRAP transporter large permease n=1 Tax=Salicibibacter cibarius TaxID=2743000 RepID=A0A7T7CD97_9BACI|nr:TRAP transporter large permease [Salicibibacter cibarius]QQK77779.1 TRAP transporter large permease [Salicibibacter cibarius]
MVSTLFIVLLILFVLTVPVAVSLGLASILSLWVGDRPLSLVPQYLFQGLDSFTLMAAPFFILAGFLMQSGGISKRLINFANALIGWARGGLASAAVLTSMFFSTMSGSSSATTAAVGQTLIPAMEKKGYTKKFAAATVASSGELGAILPPSLSLIMYGLVANVSIGSLFIAGILPGIFIGITLILTVIIWASVKKYDNAEKLNLSEWLKSVGQTFLDSILAFLMPFLILGGIYLGWFTPTEAAVVAVVYGFIIGFFVYREITIKDVGNILANSALISAILLLIVGFANVFSYILTSNQMPHQLAEIIQGISENPIVFLLLVNVLLLFIGMFMETLTSVIILGPILAPIALQYGIDPVHFGIIMIVNLAVGMITPPIGVNLFVASEIAKIPFEQIIKPISIFLGVLIVNILIITYLPGISLWLLPE